MLVGVLVDVLLVAGVGVRTRILLPLTLTQFLELLSSLHDRRLGGGGHSVAFGVAPDEYHLCLAWWDQDVVLLTLLWLHHFETLEIAVLHFFFEG